MLEYVIPEKQINYSGVKGDKERNAQHKLYVLGLVADKKHRQEHYETSAKCRKNEKPFFGRAETDTVQFGYLFVVKADYYRDHRNYRNVYDKYRQKEIVLNEFKHCCLLLFFLTLGLP